MPVTGTVTVTVHVSLWFPSLEVTVITALPPFRAVTVPFWSTPATEGLLLDQTTLLSEASSGSKETVSVSELFLLSDNVCLFNAIPFSGVVTVTVQVSVYPPSFAVTVITAVPFETAVTLPVLSTAAMEGLLEDQTTVWSEAVSGTKLTVRYDVSPLIKLSESVFRCTSTKGVDTLTIQVSVYPPSRVVAVIVAVPLETAVTLPALSTVATAVFELFHVTVLSDAAAGRTAAWSCSFSPVNI